jgi:hypothetical protein
VTNFLTTEQLADLMQINAICQTMQADLVVIAATEILIQLGNLGRLTRDIDVAIALDPDDFRSLSGVLESAGMAARRETGTPRILRPGHHRRPAGGTSPLGRG